MLLFLFALEWVLNIIAKKDYSLSFYFWLDLIATISLIQDIDYIMNPLLGFGPTSTNNKSSQQAAKALAKVSSASRATRVLRVIRIVRLIRLVKLYKNVMVAREKQEKLKKEEKLRELAMLEKQNASNSSNAKSDSRNKEGMRLSIVKASTSKLNNNSSLSSNREVNKRRESITVAGTNGIDRKVSVQDLPMTLNLNKGMIPRNELQQLEQFPNGETNTNINTNIPFSTKSLQLNTKDESPKKVKAKS